MTLQQHCLLDAAQHARARQYIEEAIVGFLADPPGNAYQSGYLAALLAVHREAFGMADTTETLAARDLLRPLPVVAWA